MTDPTENLSKAQPNRGVCPTDESDRRAFEAGWQTMDTAPKDGSMILVYNPMFGVYSTSYTTQWVDGDDDYQGFPCGFHEGIFGAWDCQPTHWMPLPELPKATTAPKPFTFADPNAQREWERQRRERE